MEPVQSRMRQRSRHLEPPADLTGAFLLGATGCFLTTLAAALVLGGDLVFDTFLGATFLAIGFFAGATLAFDTEDLVAFALGIVDLLFGKFCFD